VYKSQIRNPKYSDSNASFTYNCLYCNLDSLIITRHNTTRRQLKTARSQFSFLSVTKHSNKETQVLKTVLPYTYIFMFNNNCTHMNIKCVSNTEIKVYLGLFTGQNVRRCVFENVTMFVIQNVIT
jgi:hypothetical protein